MSSKNEGELGYLSLSSPSLPITITSYNAKNLSQPGSARVILPL